MMRRRDLLLCLCIAAASCGGGGNDLSDAAEDADVREDPVPDPAADETVDDGGRDEEVLDTLPEPDADAAPDSHEDPARDPIDEEASGACAYELIHEHAGLLFEVTEPESRLVVTPGTSATGFRCIRVELDIEAPGNIDEIAAMGLGCPIFLHIAGISIPDGDRRRAVAAAWFRFRAVGCTPRSGAELEVAVNAASDGFRGSVGPGRTYHVVLEVDLLETARLAFSEGGEPVGPELTLPIEGITRDRTSDFTIAFGLDGIGDGAYFPYFGARYSDLRVYADSRM